MVLAPSTPMRPVSRLRHFWVRKARIPHSWGTRPWQDRTWNAFKWLEIILPPVACNSSGKQQPIVWHMAGMSGGLSSAVWNAFHECCLLRVPKGLDGHSGHGMGSSPALDQGSHQAIILVGGCRLSKLWSKVLQLSDLSVRWKVKRWISCPSWCSKIH